VSDVFVGRQSERDGLLALLAGTEEGRGSVVVVEGEGGVGKSALLTTMLEVARAGEFHVLSGRSWELSASVPYESFVAAVGRHLRSRPAEDIARLTAGLPTLGALIEGLDLQPPTVAPEAFKVRAQDAFATLIARIGADRPVVLALDDLHWADQASLEVLRYLCLDLPDAPLLVVVSIRPDEADRRPELRQLLALLRRSPSATTIRLGRLDRPAIDSVVVGRLGSDIAPRIYEMVATRSGGTPLLIHELLDDLIDQGAIAKVDNVWRVVSEDLPLTGSASDLIRTRLDRVEAHDRAVLEALAVVNGPTDPAIVASLLGADIADVEGSLGRLRANRLAVRADREITTGQASWMVEHPVVAEVVESELVDAARRRLHRRLLAVDPNAPLGRRARHALIAGEPTDRLATIALLADAGTEALARATPSAAIDPLRGALSLLHVEDVGLRHRIERDLGIAYLRHLEVDLALVHLRAAWSRAEVAGDTAAIVELLQPLDTAEFRAGNGGVSTVALERLRSAIATQQSWGLLVELGWVHLQHSGRSQSVAEFQHATSALALVPATSMPERGEALLEMLDAYNELGQTASRSAGAWVDYFLDAADRWEAFADLAHRYVLLAFDQAAMSGDRALVARCQAMHRLVEERTGEPPTWRLPMVEGLRNIAEGRLDDRPIDLRLFGATTRAAVMAELMSALAARYTDGPQTASDLFEHALASVSGLAQDRTALNYVSCGRLLLAIGTADEADVAARSEAAMADNGLQWAATGYLFGYAVPLACGLSDDPETRATAIAVLDRAGARRWLPSAWACLLRARDAATPEAKASELLLAADILQDLDRTLEAAERTIDAAEVDPNGLDIARTSAALDVARRAGAAWLVTRAEALLPTDSARPIARDSDGPLTTRELEVVTRVAEGLTNREIGADLYISIRTVTSHLDHIYTKLGLSSRDALSVWHQSRNA
jgi:DNA-binding CsgD family transcriptional regulator